MKGKSKPEAPAAQGSQGSEKWSHESLGLKIRWQEGPLGQGANRKEPNGTTLEEVITSAKDRLEFHEKAEGGKFSCFENQQAIIGLNKALAYLANRTKNRQERGVEGTDEA